ncbi:MAG: sulfatase [Elusimicrobiota bacterium]
MRRSRVGPKAVILFLAVAALAGRAALAAPGARAVVLLSIDDLRRDEAHGAAFERLRRESVEFTEAQTAATWTLPSHASMLTSLSPSAHGAGGAEERPLPDWTPFAPALLARRGYRTAAFVQAAFLDRAFGFARGFDTHQFDGPLHSTRTFSDALAWLTKHRAEPLFLFVHTSAVHRAARLPDSAARSGPFRCPLPIDYLHAFPVPPPMTFSAASCLGARYNYENAVACLDPELASFLAGVDAELDPASTLVIVTSDHGESLCDGGDPHRRGHAGPPFDEQEGVPLFVRYPGGLAAGTRRGEPVSLLDIAPTILAQTDVPAPGAWEGVPLEPSSAGPADRPLFSEDDGWRSVTRRDQRLVSFNGGRTELWRSGRVDNAPETEAAKKALVRVLDEHGARTHGSRRQLETRAPYAVPASTAAIPTPTREALRFAGYLP